MGLQSLQFFQLLCDDLGIRLQLLVDVDVLLYLLFLLNKLSTKTNQAITILLLGLEQVRLQLLGVVHQKQVIALQLLQSIHQFQDLSTLSLPLKSPSRFGLIEAVFLALCASVHFIQLSFELHNTVLVPSQFSLVSLGDLSFFLLMNSRYFLCASPLFSYFFELVLDALDLLFLGDCDLVMLCEDILHFLTIRIFLLLAGSLQRPHLFVKRCVETDELCFPVLLEFQLAGELDDDLLVLLGVLEVSSELLVLLYDGLDAEVPAVEAGEFAHFLEVRINFNNYEIKYYFRRMDEPGREGKEGGNERLLKEMTRVFAGR